MSEEKTKVCPYCGCGSCGDDESGEKKDEKTQEKKSQHISSREDMHFAILLALVPAMAMSLFNLMGLV